MTAAQKSPNHDANAFALDKSRCDVRAGLLEKKRVETGQTLPFHAGVPISIEDDDHDLEEPEKPPGSLQGMEWPCHGQPADAMGFPPVGGISPL